MTTTTRWAFETEAALCRAFLVSIPDNWVAYPETCGWDILLVHRTGGWQIGIQAKLTLNAKVLVQAINRRNGPDGPDFRAVLVGRISAEHDALAHALGLTVISPREMSQSRRPGGWWDAQGPLLPVFRPDLPQDETLDRIPTWWSSWDHAGWFDEFPTERHRLPEYVPEVAAGVPSPMILSDWKIKAMRVCIWVERMGTITRAQFRVLGIDPSRWMTGHWLAAGPKRGDWVAGPGFPAAQLRREHPGIYPRVEADFETWAVKLLPPKREAAE
ncbi:hypothetical protein [Frigidibacter oleivorans]|uniref:hypothetical protein n=1 Tax=Frigidibacter oleivorans TaxID=2487129 RepID=UPI000F8D4DC2|nr:hypothetical protein [Frigidibacter oleivorans]